MQTIPLLEGESANAVLADKGYDTDQIVEKVIVMGAEAVIPPKSNRKRPRNYDEFLYKERNLIERMFGKMKHFRGIATRYNKLAISFLAFLQLSGILLWLR